MACSCKSGPVQVRPYFQQKLNTVLEQNQSKLKTPETLTDSLDISAQAQAAEVSIKDYNFDFSTKPYQNCTNCAMKHIAYASVLWLQPQTPIDKFIACSQIMCAAYHYKTFFSSLSYYCTLIAQYLMYHREDTQLVQQLLEISLNPPQVVEASVWPQYLQDWKIPASTAKLMYILSQLTVVYSLLFAQLGYLELNKGFALGHLQRAAVYLQLQQHQKLKDLQFKVRQLWKLIQQMTYMDGIYKQCRQRLQQILKTVIEVFEEQQV